MTLIGRVRVPLICDVDIPVDVLLFTAPGPSAS
jgi:hypothetical protein